MAKPNGCQLGCAKFKLALPICAHTLQSMELYAALIGFIGAVIGAVAGAFVAGHYSRQATAELLAEQRKLRQEDANARAKAVILALYHELDSVWSLYMQSVGSEVEKVPAPGQRHAFLIRHPMYSDYFPIYAANAGNVGLISDTIMRDRIVAGYTMAKSLMDSFQMNNALLEEDSAAELEYLRSFGINNSAVPAQCKKRKERSEIILNDYGNKLRALHGKCKVQAEALLADLRTYKNS